MNRDKIIIHSDGGARGNPGPGACAFIVETGKKVLHKESKYLGDVTNNVAEYGGVVEALRWVTGNLGLIGKNDSIEFYMDSELVVKQINGIYKVRDQKLKNLFLELSTLLKKIPVKISFLNVPRNKNKVADFLVNQELDKKG